MAGTPATPLKIPKQVRKRLEEVVRARCSSQGLVQRAKIVLMAGKGMSIAATTKRLGCNPTTVRKWRNRFGACPKITSLFDAERSGRPPIIPMAIRCELIQIACDRPQDRYHRFQAIWTASTLQKVLRQSTGYLISTSEIRRILCANALKPWQVRAWLHSPDPLFRQKVETICQIYLRKPDSDEVVLCIDEKPGMQALEHKRRLKPVAPGRPCRKEYEYIRHGTSTLIAAFDPHSGTVFGTCGPTRTADDLVRFMESIAARYPIQRVTIIWDNLNIHHGARWQEFNERHGNRFQFVHTPLHASWVNQVEIWFGILQRRALKHNSFESSIELSSAVQDFIEYWNCNEACPFRWKFRGNFTSERAAA